MFAIGMRLISDKDTSKFIFIVLSVVFIISCIPKHKFDFGKNKLSHQEMASVMTDIFLMESYVSEKMVSADPDSITAVKRSFYKKILSFHNADSLSFYSTFNYLQAHPKELSDVLAMVDSSIGKIKPGDTSSAAQKIIIPGEDDVQFQRGAKEQEKRMREEFAKRKKAYTDSITANNKKK
jgi:hypothetical protein